MTFYRCFIAICKCFLCTEIAVQEDFAPSKYEFWRDLMGRALKISRLAITYHILRSSHTLLYNLTTALDFLLGWEGCPSPFIILIGAFGISICGTLGASSVVPHFADQSYAPGWAPGFPPAKSGPGQATCQALECRALFLVTCQQMCLLLWNSHVPC